MIIFRDLRWEDLRQNWYQVLLRWHLRIYWPHSLQSHLQLYLLIVGGVNKPFAQTTEFELAAYRIMSFRNKHKIQKLQNLLRTWVDVVNRPNFEQLGSIFDLLIKTYSNFSTKAIIKSFALRRSLYIHQRSKITSKSCNSG